MPVPFEEFGGSALGNPAKPILDSCSNLLLVPNQFSNLPVGYFFSTRTSNELSIRAHPCGRIIDDRVIGNYSLAMGTGNLVLHILSFLGSGGMAAGIKAAYRLYFHHTTDIPQPHPSVGECSPPPLGGGLNLSFQFTSLGLIVKRFGAFGQRRLLQRSADRCLQCLPAGFAFPQASQRVQHGAGQRAGQLLERFG